MTGRPAALRALAFASTASVADSAMPAIRAEILVGASAMAPMIPSFAARPDPIGSDDCRVWPALSRRVRVNWAVRRLGRRHVHFWFWWCVHQWPVHARASRHRAVAQLARVPVSKTGGWGFESLLPCEYGLCVHGQMAAPADS